MQPVLDRGSQPDCATWAKMIIDYLHDHFSSMERYEALKPVTALATEMLSHLLIASMTSHPHD